MPFEKKYIAELEEELEEEVIEDEETAEIEPTEEEAAAEEAGEVEAGEAAAVEVEAAAEGAAAEGTAAEGAAAELASAAILPDSSASASTEGSDPSSNAFENEVSPLQSLQPIGATWAAFGYSEPPPPILASSGLVAQLDAPANANIASDASGVPSGTLENPTVVYDKSGNVVGYQYIADNGTLFYEPVDKQEGSEGIRFADDHLNVMPPLPSVVQPAPPPQFPQLTPAQADQLNTAIQQAVGPDVAGPIDATPPESINEVLAGTDWASPDPIRAPSAPSPPAGSGTVPFNPMADSPIASWLLYGNDTPVLDWLTNDSNLQAVQNIALGVSFGAATIATGGMLLQAAPAVLPSIGIGAQTALTGGATALTGVGGIIATTPGLPEEIEEGVDSMLPTLGAELDESLPSAAEQAATRFQDIVRQAQSFLNDNTDLVGELGGSSKGAPITPNQLGAAIGQYAQGNPGFARALGGNAMEALVNAIIEDFPPGAGSFEQVSGPSRIDFIGTGAFEGYTFELTTEAGVAGHALRGYMQEAGAMIFTYSPIID